MCLPAKLRTLLQGSVGLDIISGAGVLFSLSSKVKTAIQSVTRKGFVRHMLAARINSFLYSPDISVPDKYHLWYYNTGIWETSKWMGVITKKSPADMWNYQEIISELQPSLIVEFGTAFGGSALFFASVMQQFGRPFKVLSVDTDFQRVSDK